MALEKIEVGKTYVNISLGFECKRTVTAIGEKKVLFKRSEDKQENEVTDTVESCKALWSELPKPKKRYWLWDIRYGIGTAISISGNYADENGFATNGKMIYDKSTLLRKHEDKFIDIDVE